MREQIPSIRLLLSWMHGNPGSCLLAGFVVFSAAFLPNILSTVFKYVKFASAPANCPYSRWRVIHCEALFDDLIRKFELYQTFGWTCLTFSCRSHGSCFSVKNIVKKQADKIKLTWWVPWWPEHVFNLCLSEYVAKQWLTHWLITTWKPPRNNFWTIVTEHLQPWSLRG